MKWEGCVCRNSDGLWALSSCSQVQIPASLRARWGRDSRAHRASWFSFPAWARCALPSSSLLFSNSVGSQGLSSGQWREASSSSGPQEFLGSNPPPSFPFCNSFRAHMLRISVSRWQDLEFLNDSTNQRLTTQLLYPFCGQCWAGTNNRLHFIYYFFIVLNHWDFRTFVHNIWASGFFHCYLYSVTSVIHSKILLSQKAAGIGPDID